MICLAAGARVTVKLDRELVSGIDKKESLRMVTGGILRTIQGLGLRAIAEGIETEGEAQVLRDLGCDDGQGWLWSRAVPANEFAERWLKKG